MIPAMLSPKPLTKAQRQLYQHYVFRFGIGLAALGTFMLFWALKILDIKTYVFLTSLPDGVRKATPFVDLLAILQAGKCFRAGIDVYRPSACLFGSTFNYAPFLLRAAYLPIGPSDTALGGCMLALGFFASLNLLPKPVSLPEFLCRLAATLSPAIFYGVEQGNFDLAIFAVALAGVLQMLRGAGLRSAGYALFALGAACKFYPAALFVLALRERRGTLILLASLGLLAVILLLALDAHGILAALTSIPSGTPFRATFGAIDLPRGILRLYPIRGGRYLADGLSLLLSAAGICISYRLRRRHAAALMAMPPAQRLFLIAGATVTVLCFYAAQNVCYRAVFLLFTLPGLCAIGRRHRPTQILLAAILIVLWETVPRAIFTAPEARTIFWLARECLWWWIVIELGAITAGFMATEISRLARRQTA